MVFVHGQPLEEPLKPFLVVQVAVAIIRLAPHLQRVVRVTQKQKNIEKFLGIYSFLGLLQATLDLGQGTQSFTRLTQGQHDCSQTEVQLPEGR